MARRPRKGAGVMIESGDETTPRGESASNRVMSLAAIASMLDRDRNTIAKWLEQGCPAIQRGNKATGTPWELDIADVVKWLVRRAAESEATRSPPGEPGHIPEDEAKRRRVVALMKQDEIDAAERLREVVAISLVTHVVAREYSEVRKSLLPLGAKAGPRCEGKTAGEIKLVVDGLVSAALENLTYDQELTKPDA